MGKKSRQKKLSKTPLNALDILLRPLSDEQIESLSSKELKIVLRGEQKISQIFREAYIEKLALAKEMEDKILCIEGQLVRLKHRVFSPSSERSPRPPRPPGERPQKTPIRKDRDLQVRYPNADVIEKEIRLETLPSCSCCQGEMSEMGVWEQSQYLTVIPKKYLITNVLRMKYHCSHCHGNVQTTPQLPRVIPRSSYGDAFLIDLALSKFCDLIPVERYCEMAKRQGFGEIPSSSMHELIFKLAQFLKPVYELVRIETLDALVLQGDETTHRMLESSETMRWYLWGFFSSIACFFECHDTRSGDVAGDVLSESGCKYFVSDAYTGYSKAIRETNELRKLAGLELIIEVLCNAHSRRYFDECGEENQDAKTIVAEYKVIYREDKEVRALLPNNFEEAAKKRAALAPNFEAIKQKVEADLPNYSTNHSYYKAGQYFLNNYIGLTECLKNPWIPLDNNRSERGLRSHVVGRKTWYGTHSERMAEAEAIHLSLIESCKMNGANPREYFKEIVDAILCKRPFLTPHQYAKKYKSDLAPPGQSLAKN